MSTNCGFRIKIRNPQEKRLGPSEVKNHTVCMSVLRVPRHLACSPFKSNKSSGINQPQSLKKYKLAWALRIHSPSNRGARQWLEWPKSLSRKCSSVEGSSCCQNWVAMNYVPLESMFHSQQNPSFALWSSGTQLPVTPIETRSPFLFTCYRTPNLPNKKGGRVSPNHWELCPNRRNANHCTSSGVRPQANACACLLLFYSVGSQNITCLTYDCSPTGPWIATCTKQLCPPKNLEQAPTLES